MTIHLRTWGDLACFTRPEMKVERVSYPVMTPSAARGLLESILYKPQFRWRVLRIAVKKPIRFLSFRRNEVKSRLSPRKPDPMLADEDRTQRNTLALRDVEYINSKDLAYRCGQLFAVIGRLQLLALGKIGASIAERTYGGVATRPATTFGPLFTKLPAYLKKANTRFPGSGTNKQKEIEAICVTIDQLGGIPKTLGLEEQGRFALGYYCQLAQYRADRLEEEAARKSEELPAETV